MICTMSIPKAGLLNRLKSLAYRLIWQAPDKSGVPVALLRKCESEPERVFLRSAWEQLTGLGYKIIPQYEISGGRYRADFGILKGRVRAVVEIDGYAYHSNKLSFVGDRKRERNIQRAGYHVVRFAAVEVLQKPNWCVGELVEYLRGLERHLK